MGFLKNLGTLKQQADEMQRGRDVKTQMADGLARMQQAGAVMQQQAAATTLAVNGQPATASITGLRQTGMQVNFAPVVEIDLVVLRNGIPMPTTVREAVPQIALARVRIGERLHVKTDPRQPAAVWIDWFTPA
jgi:hypothetical protein